MTDPKPSRAFFTRLIAEVDPAGFAGIEAQTRTGVAALYRDFPIYEA